MDSLQGYGAIATQYATEGALKVGAALLFWIVGRWLIGLVGRLLQELMQRQKVDPTLMRYLGNILSVMLNIALVVAILGYCGIETTSFAALVAGVGIAIGAVHLSFHHTPVGERVRKGLGIAVATIIVIEMALVLTSDRSGLVGGALKSYAADHSNTKELGSVMYTLYAYPFEIAALILLVAIVAAIGLTMRRRQGVRYVDPAEQVAVRREGRVRLVNLAAEKKS